MERREVKDLDLKRQNINGKNGKLFKKQDDKMLSSSFFAHFSCFNMRKKYWLKLEHLLFCVLAISYSKLEYFEVEGIDAEVLFNLSYMKMLLCYGTCDSVVSLLSTSYSNAFAISYSNLKFFTSSKIMFNLEVISISQKVLALLEKSLLLQLL